jgi:hypothetical protein
MITGAIVVRGKFMTVHFPTGDGFAAKAYELLKLIEALGW